MGICGWMGTDSDHPGRRCTGHTREHGARAALCYRLHVVWYVNMAYERGLAEAEALSDMPDEHSLTASPCSY
jgi:hypothetical protein